MIVKYFFTYLFTFLIVTVSAENFAKFFAPVINTHVSHEFGAGFQVWDIVQDSTGVFYLATNEGVVTYDGKTYSKLDSPNKSVVRSLAKDKHDILYLGATDEFGYLKPNNEGQLKYISLSDSVGSKPIGAVLKTFCIADKVYFIANHNRIFVYSDNHLSELSNIPVKHFRAFNVNNKLYLFSEVEGAWMLKENNFIQLSLQIEFPVYTALPYSANEILIGTLNNGIFLFDIESNNTKSLNSKLNEQLKNANVYHALNLNNKNIAIATLKYGVFIIDRQGNELKRIEKNDGLLSNTGFCAYQDKYGDLWIGHETGCSQIQINSHVQRITSSMGFEGSNRSIVQFNNMLYLATSSGIFYSQLENYGNNLSFNLINENFIYGLDLCVISLQNKQLLLGSTLRELVWIKPNNTLEKIMDLYACQSIVKSKKYKNRIFLGGEFGILSLDLDYSNGKLTILKSESLAVFENPVRELEISDNEVLWVRTSLNKIYRINLQNPINEKSVQEHSELYNKYPDIILTSINKYKNKIYVTSSKGVYSYNLLDTAKNKIFIEESIFSKEEEIERDYVQQIEFDNSQNCYITYQDKLLISNIKKNAHKEVLFEEISESIQYIKNVENLGTCLLGQNNIYLLNKQYKYKNYSQFNTLINKVEIHNFETIKFDKPSKDISYSRNIPLENNSIDFWFSAPFFRYPEEVVYATQLVGYDKSWSEFSMLSHRMFTNLPGGNYIFKIKAKNIYQKESEITTFSFTIHKPWYLRNWFIVLCTIAFIYILVSWSIMFYRSKRKIITRSNVPKEPDPISNIYDITTHTNSVTIELEKIMELVSRTNKAIAIVDSSGDLEWINDGYTKLYGFKLHEILLNEISIFGSTKDQVLKSALVKWENSKDPFKIVIEKENSKGGYTKVSSTLTPIYNNGLLQRLIMVDEINPDAN